VGCVTYFYIGPVAGLEGGVGFQVTGILVAVVIAHYSHRMFKEINRLSEEYEEEDDDDVQE